MRVVATAITALVLGGLCAYPGEAALVVGLSVAPERPRARGSVTLYVRTYAPISAPGEPCGFRREPWRVDYPFRVQVTAPEGTAYRIRVRQGEENLYVGTMRLPNKPGLWTIRVLNFFTRYNRYDPCSGALLRFRVRSS
jgi:hypothetical protein